MNLPNQQGQLVMESLLIMVVFVGLAVLVINIFNERAYVQQVVQGPWTYMAGMVESGVWKPKDEALKDHPNHSKRHSTITGDSDL